MIISKARVQSGAKPSQPPDDGGGKGIPKLEDFLARRDYVGAIALLTAQRRAARRRRGGGGQQQQTTAAEDQQTAEEEDAKALEWLAYAHFHFGEHDKALAIYKELLAGPDPDPSHHTYAAACLFHMGRYADVEAAAAAGGPRASPLAGRVLLHCAHKRGDEAALMRRHQELPEGLEDELSLAAVHYQRGHYQEATDIYKRLMLAHRDYVALAVYVAMCYARLEYHDVAQEVLAEYLAVDPISPVALNLKACNAFKLSDGRAAEAALKPLRDAPGGPTALRDHPLLRHNACVFAGGAGALQALPPLAGGLIPEADLNLVIFQLRRGDVDEAWRLVKGLEPATPQEYILKAIVRVLLGQRDGGAEHLREAQRAFHLVGSSQSECDTIPGRQAMAASCFLQRQWGDVIVFLESIKSYFSGDDDFAYQYGIALAGAGRFADAEAALASVKSEAYRREDAYVAWMCRALIGTGRASAAWDLLAAHEAAGGGAADPAGLLRLVANDAYRYGAFLVAARAFDALGRVDPGAQHSEALLGACVGVFQAVVAGGESPDALSEAAALLAMAQAAPGGGPAGQHAAAALRAMRQWANDNGFDL